MSAPNAAEFTTLLGALTAASADWRQATWDLAYTPLNELDTADTAARDAGSEYGHALRDMEQAIARLALTEVAS